MRALIAAKRYDIPCAASTRARSLFTFTREMSAAGANRPFSIYNNTNTIMQQQQQQDIETPTQIDQFDDEATTMLQNQDYDDDETYVSNDEEEDEDEMPSVEYPYSKLTNKMTPNTEVLHEWMRAARLPFTNQGIFAEQYAILQFTCGVVPPELEKRLNPNPFKRRSQQPKKKMPVVVNHQDDDWMEGEDVWFVARRAPKYAGLGTADSPFDLIL